MESNEKWASQLRSDSFENQISALREITRQSDVEGLAAQVIDLAGSRHDEVRMWAAEALQSAIRPTIQDAKMLIDQLQNSDDGEVCYWTATLLGRLGEPLSKVPEIASDAVKTLESCLRDSLYLPARERAASALRQLGPVSRTAVPTLRQVARHAPPRLQRLTNETLEALEEAA